MKHLKLYCLLACIFFNFQVNAQATKHALIIAVGNYPKENGWPTIASIRDVSLVDSALVKQGFKPENIKILTDAQVTPGGIDAVFDDLSKRVKPGDVVVIHVSSHGEQIADDNGDEADGLDECIVTYNAISPYANLELTRGGKMAMGKMQVSLEQFNKIQNDYYRDDRLGAAVNKLRARLGKDGDVLVFMDLCHSGTGLRGDPEAKARGGQPALIPPAWDPTLYSTKDTSEYADNLTVNEKNLATYVVISAARAEELDFEAEDNGQKMGSLSYAISKVLINLDSLTTYRTMFAKIQSVMHEKVPGQHPVLESSEKGIDRQLFGGKFVIQKPYLEITEIKDKQITVNGGLFSGLDKGAKVAIYPNTTLDPAKENAITTGTVTKATNYTAVVQLEKKSGFKNPSDGRVFITVPAFKVDPISLKIVNDKSRGSRGAVVSFSDAEEQTIKGALKNLNVTFEGKPELLLVKGTNKDSIKLANNEYLFNVVNTGNTNDLQKAIEQYAQYKFLQSFSAKDENVQFEVKLIPAVNGKPDTTKISTKIKLGTLEFTKGDAFFLLIKNTSSIPIYINILDMQPDGIINAIIPNRKQNIVPSELKIEPGITRLFDKYKITVAPPYGTELFKIFASTQELDLEGIATTRSVQGRGNLQGLEKIVKNSYNVATRGAEGENIESTDGTTYNLFFEIKPKE